MNNKDIEHLIRKKIETTMIGAIARFEEGFGDLWGHNSNTKSQEQLRNKMIWDNIRESILDHGNTQIRKSVSELRGNKNIDKPKYSYYYKFNQNKEQ